MLSYKEIKLRTFCTFKEKIEVKNYLLMTDDKQYCSNFTKLRINSHKLMIETGRYKKSKKKQANASALTVIIRA